MKVKLSRWGAAAGAVILAAVGTIALPVSAIAADLGEVQGVSVTPQEVYVGEQFSVEVDFRVPSGAQSGDTFTVNIPTDYVTGRAGTIAVTDATNNVIANCTVTDSSAVCQYTDYVDTHSNVSGTARLVVIANNPNETNGLDWVDASGANFHTDNVIKIRGGYPQYLAKNGEGLSNGNIRFYSGFPGAVLSPNYSSWTDTYDPRLTLDRSSVVVQQCAADGSGCWVTLSSDEYVVHYDDPNFEFSVDFKNPVRDNSIAYRMIYEMQPQSGLSDKTELHNSVAAGIQTFDYTYIYRDGGGNGSGDQGSLTWNKVDQKGNTLGGASFRVTGPNGFDKTVADNDSSDLDKADGKFSVQKLAAGVYTLTEVTAPTGYQLGSGSFEATVSEAVLNGSFGDIVNVPLAGSLTWKKVDEKGAALAGASFKLVGPDGYVENVSDNGPLDSNDAAGEFSVEGLGWGVYTLTEVTAPTGYQLGSGSFEATVSEAVLNGSFGDIVNVPLAGSLTWKKVDEKGAALAGASFKLVGPDGYVENVSDNGPLDSNDAAGEFSG